MTKKILIQSDLPEPAPDRSELPAATPNGQDYLYRTPKGFPVKELSYSSYNEYAESPAKFRWKRIMGMKEKYSYATMEFGHALQAAVQAQLANNENPVERFQTEWLERSKKPNLKFGERADSDTLLTQGVGLMSTFLKQREAGMYQMKNLKFPEMKAGTGLKMFDPETQSFYQSFPDIIGEDGRGPFVCDIKALDKPIPNATLGLIVNDTQLRTQAALSGINRVVLWVFARTAKNPPAPSAGEVAAFVVKYMHPEPGGVTPAEYVLDAVRRILGLNIEDAGKVLGIENPKILVKELRDMRKHPTDEQQKALNALENAITALTERRAPQYSIEWHEGQMTRSWALSAVKDQLRVVADIRAGHFPCRCSVRWPQDSVHTCPYRGLCLLEATASPTPEQVKVWNEITAENLEGWDADSLKGL